ncbi:MAG: hypothetical protein JNM89_08060 [Hyphomicrobiaceae bacterium]|nr:hypothetical protein [Hyphomicrobiaceae bacterium]
MSGLIDRGPSKSSRWRGLAVGALLALAAAPLSFLAGVFVMGALMIWKSGPVAGEALQGAAFTAFLFGGPLGILGGSLLIGGLGAWHSSRLSWPVVMAAAIALTMASSWALGQLGNV